MRRHPHTVAPELANGVRFGASPRSSIALERFARARAWLVEFTGDVMQREIPEMAALKSLNSAVHEN